MAPMGVYDQIKKAFQDVVAPELNTLRGDIRLLDQKIDAVDQRLGQKIDGVDQRLSQKIDGLDQRLSQRIDGLEAVVNGRFAGMDIRFDRLEAKIEGLDDRVTSLRTETVSMKGELIAEIRRVDVRIDSVDRELRIAIDVRERLAALEARFPAS